MSPLIDSDWLQLLWQCSYNPITFTNVHKALQCRLHWVGSIPRVSNDLGFSKLVVNVILSIMAYRIPKKSCLSSALSFVIIWQYMANNLDHYPRQIGHRSLTSTHAPCRMIMCYISHCNHSYHGSQPAFPSATSTPNRENDLRLHHHAIHQHFKACTYILCKGVSRNRKWHSSFLW